VTQVRLTEDVYLVGSGSAFGFGLSGELDSHVYAIDGGGELALVDCGMAAGDSLDEILGNVRTDGLDPNRISRLFLTHYHVDHAGGAARFREALGLEVSASAHAAAAISAGDEHATGLAIAQRAGFYPETYRLLPCPVDVELGDGDVVSVGETAVRAVETPGHCDGHMCYLLNGRRQSYLFGGDCVFFGGQILLQNIPDCNIQAYARSVQKLRELEFESYLPGHLVISLRDGKRHVETAASAFDRLFLPKNLI
jgi:glyoxylase-like metal-dependent hydrolase (beta-lactamase superfamily II)